MIRIRVRRAVAALITAAATLVLLPTPASASWISADVTDGSFLLVPWWSQTGAPVPLLSPACPAPTAVVDVTSTSVEIIDLNGRTRFRFAGNDYVAVIDDQGSSASYPGAVSGSTVSGVGFGVTMDIYSAAPGGACSGGVFTCDLAFGLDLTGTYSGNPSAPAPGDVLTLAGWDTTSISSPTACGSPFAGYIYGTVEVLPNLLAGTQPLEITIS
ncbi:MAG TPA: hypothetical protein VK507_07930 [Iamia sp.]|nr:hypothetical protein [Iamia sp.]